MVDKQFTASLDILVLAIGLRLLEGCRRFGMEEIPPAAAICKIQRQNWQYPIHGNTCQPFFISRQLMFTNPIENIMQDPAREIILNLNCCINSRLQLKPIN